MDRLLATYPKPWTSDQARQPGGVLYSLLDSLFAYDLVFILNGLIYVQQSTRIKTAVNGALDIISEDYFGNGLPRLNGESDSQFRARILAALLQPRVTRQAIYNAILQLVGLPPRMIEPWIPGDTCAWDALSYWDTDDITYPFRWGDAATAWQGFIIAQEPLFTVTGGIPVPCWDDGFFFDSAQTYWLDRTQEQELTSTGALIQLLLAFKAAGTMIWLAAIPPQSTLDTGYSGLDPGSMSFDIALDDPIYPYMKGFMPLIAIENPSWFTNIWIPDALNNPPLAVVSTPSPPSLTSIGWTALSQGLGFLRVPVQEGTTEIYIPPSSLVPPGDDVYLLFFPNWNTTKAYPLFTSAHNQLQFGTPAPAGAYIDVCALQNLITAPGWIFGASVFTPGQPQLPGGATSYTIDHGISLPYKVFAQGTWQTQISVTKLSGRTIFNFSTPASPGSPHSSDALWWVIQEG